MHVSVTEVNTLWRCWLLEVVNVKREDFGAAGGGGGMC